MAKIFTQQEVEAIVKAQEVLRTHGLVVDDIDGEKDVAHNSERMAAFFDQNPTYQITSDSVIKICLELMRDQLHWLTPAERAYNQAYRALPSPDQDQFGAWWHRSAKQTLITDGEKGFENASRIIGWMTGRTFNQRNLDLAVSNLSGTTGLHFAHQSSFRPGKHSGGDSSFMPKDGTNLTARDHKRLRDEAAAAGRVPEKPGKDFRSLAKEVRGRTHSQTEQIQRMYVTRPGTSETDWEATYAARRRAAGL